MTEEPLIPRPAATVMLIRDTAEGIKVFLMRRHSAMDFVAGVMVFPGGGVDDRDRHADVAWFGPEPGWWADRFGVEPDLAEALVCAAARETFEESGVLFAGPADDPDGIVGDASIYREARLALADSSLSFGEFLRRENLVLRADLLRPWANWVTPKEERTRRYDTYFFVGALPEGQRADGDNTETDRAVLEHAAGAARRSSPSHGRSCCRRPGRSWTRSPGAPSPKCSPWNVRSSPVEPHLPPRRTATGRSSSSTATATTAPATTARPMATGLTRRLHERVRLRPHQR